MDKNTQDKILKFRGDIRSAFEFLMSVYNDLGFPVQTNLKAISRPFDTFANSIRSYRQKGIIQPVEKSGVRLILTGRNLIQYLLVQRLLFVGANLKALQEIVPALPYDSLNKLILADSTSVADLPLPRASLTGSSIRGAVSSQNTLPLWFHLKINKDAILHLRGDKYLSFNFDELKRAIKTVLDHAES